MLGTINWTEHGLLLRESKAIRITGDFSAALDGVTTKSWGCATFIGSTATSSMVSPTSSMYGRDMATDNLKLSRAASEYIERRAAFWLMENQPNLEPQDIIEETLNPCIEALFAEWTELINDAVETVNEKLGFSIQLRISVAKVRDDFAFLQGTGLSQ